MNKENYTLISVAEYKRVTV